MTRVRAAKQEKLETSSSIACRLRESSTIPLSQSPKVARAWLRWSARPLQKMNFRLSGCVLEGRREGVR